MIEHKILNCRWKWHCWYQTLSSGSPTQAVLVCVYSHTEASVYRTIKNYEKGDQRLEPKHHGSNISKMYRQVIPHDAEPQKSAEHCLDVKVNKIIDGEMVFFKEDCDHVL